MGGTSLEGDSAGALARGVFSFKKRRIQASWHEKACIYLAIAFFLFCASIAFADCPGVWPEEARLIRSENPEIYSWLGQRLIDPHHWARGTQFGDWPAGDSWSVPEPIVHAPFLPAYLGYGAEAFNHWKDAQLFVLENCDHLPTLEDYRQVHSLVFYNAPGDLFWGYYSRQIWQKFKDPNEKAEMNALLNKAQSDPEALQQLFDRGIKNGKGELRAEGDTSWSGKPWSMDEKRYLRFEREEFDRIARHKILRVQILKQGPDGIEARFWHPRGADVPKLLAELFSNVRNDVEVLKLRRQLLNDQEYRRQSMLLASRFYLQLVLIHGFWDGIGRSSKIMRDWILRHLGFQPPAETPENDLEYLPEEYAPILDRAVRITEERVKTLALQAQFQAPTSLAISCETALHANLSRPSTVDIHF